MAGSLLEPVEAVVDLAGSCFDVGVVLDGHEVESGLVSSHCHGCGCVCIWGIYWSVRRGMGWDGVGDGVYLSVGLRLGDG